MGTWEQNGGDSTGKKSDRQAKNVPSNWLFCVVWCESTSADKYPSTPFPQVQNSVVHVNPTNTDAECMYLREYNSMYRRTRSLHRMCAPQAENGIEARVLAEQYETAAKRR